MLRVMTCSGSLSCALACVAVFSAGSVQAASVYGGVYGWGRPSGTVKYIDKSLESEELPGVDGMYGELIHDNGGLDPAYSLKAQAVLDTDTMQGSIALSNYVAAPTVQSIDAWINDYNADTYTVIGGTPGDEVEAIFTCSISGSMTIQPLTDTDPNSYRHRQLQNGDTRYLWRPGDHPQLDRCRHVHPIPQQHHRDTLE